VGSKSIKGIKGENMSDVMYDDDLDMNDDSTSLRDLRKAYKAKEKQVKDLQGRLDEIESAGRQNTIEDVLKDSGVNEKIAKFIPSDVTTVEQVRLWLEENSEVFGLVRSDTEDTDEVKAAGRLAKLGDVAGAVDPGDLFNRIASAGSAEELNEALFGSRSGPSA